MDLSIAQPLDLLFLSFVLGFATFRLTLIVTKDVIFKELREWTIVKLAQKPEGGFRETGFRSKLAYILGCEFCVGVWVALGLTLAVVLAAGSVSFLTFLVLWMATTGVQVSLMRRLDG